jgi:TPR repeat protein
MEEMPAYARVVAGRLIHQQLNKPFLGRPYLKYGECFGLWGYLFELGGILAAKHAANLEAFVPAFLGGQGDSAKGDFTDIANTLIAERRVNKSMKFFDYVQTESIRLAKYKGDVDSFLLERGKERVPPGTAAELAQFYAIQGSALGAIYPDFVRAIFQQTYFSHTREQWEQSYAAGLDVGPYQAAKTYEEAEKEENEGFMAHCRESHAQLYSVLSEGDSVSNAFETLARDSARASVDLDALVREAKRLYRSNGEGMTEENIRAFKSFLRAAEAGHSEAQSNLGWCYRKGNGVPQDYLEAVKWFRKAADQGDTDAQDGLGYCYAEGQGVPQDYVEAIKWYRKAADQGHAWGQADLGYCYHKGQGVAQDYVEAAKWFRKAAEQGHADAQHNLGYCYAEGQGVAQDYVEAVNWFRKAAEQGHADAQHNLGYCYAEGQGVAQDYGEAVKWYRRAAEQGAAMAQHNLGICCRNGKGVPLDLPQAYKWFQLAADQGHEQAKKEATALGALMSPSEFKSEAYDAFRIGKRIWKNVILTGGSPEWRENQHKEALGYFDGAIAKGYDAAEVFSLRGNCLNNLGFYFDALEDYNKAIQRRPNNANDYFLRGMIKDSLFDFEGSFADLKEAVRLPKLDNDDNRSGDNYMRTLGWDSATAFYEFHLDWAKDKIDHERRCPTDRSVELKKIKKREQN